MLFLSLLLLDSAQAADAALVYCGEQGCSDAPDQLTEALLDAGAGRVDTREKLPSLNPYALVFVMNPRAGLQADERSRLLAWHQDGGLLVLVTECSSWAGDSVGALNTLLRDLGSPISIEEASEHPFCQSATHLAEASAFTSGMTGFQFAWTSALTAPKSQEVARYEGVLVAAGSVEERLLVVGDANVFLNFCDFERGQNLRLFANLWEIATTPASDVEAGGDDRADEASACSSAAAVSAWPAMLLALGLLVVRRR